MAFWGEMVMPLQINYALTYSLLSAFLLPRGFPMRYQHRSSRFKPVRLPLAAALAALLFVASSADAAIRTWDGNGNNDNWGFTDFSLANFGNTNWTDQAILLHPFPTNGDILRFQGSTRLTPNNDLSNLSIAGISFLGGAGAFTLNGKGITSTGDISNLSSNTQIINVPITVGADQSWDGGSVGLTVNGTVTLGNRNLTLSNKTAIANAGGLFIVGDAGSAAVTLQSGSTLNNAFGYVGGYSDVGTGSVTVDGIGSTWITGNDVYIGQSGAGSLIVQNQGTALNGGFASIGTLSGANGTATVDGAGSTWTSSGNLFVGDAGTGTLDVKNGGKINDGNGIIGYGVGSTGTVTVDGVGSKWVHANVLRIGQSGTGELFIHGGGLVSDVTGDLGTNSGAKGTVTVDGTGSTWANSGDLNVGSSGEGLLKILAGGVVTNGSGTGSGSGVGGVVGAVGDAYMGKNKGSSGTVTVNGVGSSWTDSGNLYIGDFGNGTLNIQAGGVVSDVNGFLGYGHSVISNGVSSTIVPSNGTVTVTGAGSQWNNTHLYVGNLGNGSLSISAGGVVKVIDSAGGFSNITSSIGTLSEGNGTVTVDGKDSRWVNSGGVAIGEQGRGLLNIQNGGSVSDNAGLIALTVGGYGEVTVGSTTENLSLWTNYADLSVGRDAGDGNGIGGDAILTIQNGGDVTTHRQLTVGSLGILNLNGGWLSADSATLADGGQFNWTGGSLSLSATTVGDPSSLFGTELTLDAGRVLNTGNVTVNTLASTTGGGISQTPSRLTVGNSGTLNVGSMLVVGSLGVLNLNGGSINASVAILNRGGAFNWSGGTLNLDVASVGGLNSLFGTALTVDAGRVLHVSGDLTVDKTIQTATSAPSSLTIGNAGDVSVGGMLGIGSLGVVNLYGGSLSATAVNLSPGGQFNWTTGILSLGSADIGGGNSLFGDTLTLDSSRVLNALAGGNGIVNNGTLILAGGLWGGAGALSNNADLSGYGTISGSGGFTNNALFTQGAGILTLGNTGLNTNYGNLLLASGRQFRLTGATLSNAGTFDLNNGIVTGTGTLLNSYGGTVQGTGTVSSQFSNAGGSLVADKGTTNISQGFSNTGLVQLNAATANLAGGLIVNNGTIQGQGQIGNAINNGASGIIEANANTLSLAGTLSNAGTVAVGNGAKLLAVQGLANNAGLINLTGGVFDNNSHALSNTGQISGFGILRSGGLNNSGTITLADGNSTVNGALTNALGGKVEVAHGQALFTGAVTNFGTFKNTAGSVTFAAGYTENGVYHSDPAVNHFDTLTVNPTGFLLGGAGDEFHLSQDFVNHSTQNSQWDTRQAALFFDGGTPQNFYLAGLDSGATAAGYQNNFAWGSLSLGAGTTLDLLNGGSNLNAALYVEDINLSGVNNTSLIVSALLGDFNLYYDKNRAANAYLNGLTYGFFSGSGHLIGVDVSAVPLPASVWLFGSALAGLGVIGRRRVA